MKKLIELDETEGLEKLLGKNVMIFAANYIYAGLLVGVNTTCVLLRNAGIVYETGPFNGKNYKDIQALPVSDWYIQTSAIESFGECNMGRERNN